MKRIVEIDVLRGFSLLGIIWANVMWFSGFAVASGQPTRLDEGVTFAVTVLVDGKFYSLFSLLFGVGVALAGDAQWLGRRLAVLFGLGLVHAVFLWFGDIVSLYSVTGLALLFAHRWTARRLAFAAAACLATPIAIGGLLLAATAFGGVTTGSGYGPGELLPAFRAGSYAQVLEANWTFLVDRWYLALLSSRVFRILGMFFFGMAIVRANALRNRELHARILRYAFPIALGANVLLGLCGGSAPLRPPTLTGWLTGVLSVIAVPTGCLVYATGLLLVGHKLTWLAPAGRMSFTNYVGQSLVMSLVFYGYGFALWGEIGAAGSVLIATLIFATQVALSAWWLRYFRLGPLEWLVRCSILKR